MRLRIMHVALVVMVTVWSPFLFQLCNLLLSRGERSSWVRLAFPWTIVALDEPRRENWGERGREKRGRRESEGEWWIRERREGVGEEKRWEEGERRETEGGREKSRKSDGVNWSPDACVFFSPTQTKKNWELTGLWIRMVNTPQACMHAVT